MIAVPSVVMRSASHGGTRPPCSGRSAWPERFITRIARLRQRRHQRLQELVRHAEAALVLLGEIALRVVCRVVELVFVLDVHGARVARLRQHREEAFPIHRPVSRHAEPPPARVVHRLNAAAPHDVPQNLGVLQVDVVDLVHELARGGHGSMNCHTRCDGSNCRPTCGLLPKALNSASQPTGPVAMLGPPA